MMLEDKEKVSRLFYNYLFLSWQNEEKKYNRSIWYMKFRNILYKS